jgi:hypothetical protein
VPTRLSRLQSRDFDESTAIGLTSTTANGNQHQNNVN